MTFSTDIQTLRGPDGVSAALHDLGGSGPAVLFTHGSGLNAGMWATVVPHLRDRFHCYGLDFRGHGASPQNEGAFSVERHLLIGEILAAVAAIGEDTAFGVGHSLGGATLTVTEATYPGTFAGLWVFEPVLIPDTYERPDGGPASLAEFARRRRREFDSVDAAYERFRSKPPYANCEAVAVRAYTEIGTFARPDGTVWLSCAGDTEARIYETSPAYDFASFAAVRCPTVVGLGVAVAKGNEIPPMLAPIVAKALGNGRLESFAGLTHFAPMENGAAVAASIAAHLSTVR